MDDNLFEPRLGKLRAKGSPKGRRYLAAILKSIARAGHAAGKSRRSASCGRIGRGAGIGRLLGSRDRFAGLRARRAIVKTRLIRLRGKGLGAARAHLRYIQRDGVERDGSPGMLYSAGEEAVDGKAFLEKCAGDRHQFRLIVSAEDGVEYEDLKSLTRRFMARMERDLGTRLEWVAADHVDTAHPHTHIILRGRDELGNNLVIARDYIARGMRERVAELVSLDLGPRQDWEIKQKLLREVTAERLTTIDRGLIRDAGISGIAAAAHSDPFQHALRAGRLKKLGAMELAEELGGARWRLERGVDDKLRRLGERGDIVRSMQRELAAHGLERAPADQIIHQGAVPDAGIVGRLIARGLSDEHADRHFLLVDGTDGRVHHVDIGIGTAVEPLPENSIVRILPHEAGPRASDRRVAEIAEANGGKYSAELHLAHDPGARLEFVKTHVRRLESQRRAGLPVERLEDGTWRIPSDYMGQVKEHELRRARFAPVKVELLSPVPLAQLASRHAATWLDLQLVDEGTEQLRDGGFGREVRSALALRRQWLLDQGLAAEQDAKTVIPPGAVALLRQRELSTAASQLGRELNLNFVPLGDGERVNGILRRRLDLASGRFALVEHGRDFSLVPWRPVLERQLGKQVSGIVRNDRVSWAFGRGRSGPEIS